MSCFAPGLFFFLFDSDPVQLSKGTQENRAINGRNNFMARQGWKDEHSVKGKKIGKWGERGVMVVEGGGGVLGVHENLESVHIYWKV